MGAAFCIRCQLCWERASMGPRKRTGKRRTGVPDQRKRLDPSPGLCAYGNNRHLGNEPLLGTLGGKFISPPPLCIFTTNIQENN